MRTIYLDSEFKCHITDDSTMKAVEIDFFNGKCDAYIEGHRFIPAGESWIRNDGTVFQGEAMFPWVDSRILNAHQTEYEANQETIVELDTALLDTTYNYLLTEEQ